MAREGGRRTRDDEILVVARFRITVDKGSTDKGADLDIGGAWVGKSVGMWLSDAVPAKETWGAEDATGGEDLVEEE